MHRDDAQAAGEIDLMIGKWIIVGQKVEGVNSGIHARIIRRILLIKAKTG